MKPLSTAISLLLIVCSVSLLAADDNKDPRRGRWWGKPIKSVEETDERVPEPLPPYAAMMSMHPQEIRALEEKYLDYALWKLTPQATADYYKVVSVVRGKAKVFSALHGYNKMTTLSLNVHTDNPVSNQGLRAKQLIKMETLKQKLFEAKDLYGLVHFTRKGCQFCVAQYNTLSIFERKHGWNVLHVDVDERPALALKHNIEYTPTTIIVKRGTDQWLPIAFGAETVPGIETNSYRSIRLLNGEITPKEFYTPEHYKGRAMDPSASVSL